MLTDRPVLKKLVESFRDWGRDCWCDPGCDNTCGKRFDWQLGELPARLRPQVHLLPHRLQPEADRHAGGDRRGPAQEAAGVPRRPPAQFRAPFRERARPGRVLRTAAGDAAIRAELVRLPPGGAAGRPLHCATSWSASWSGARWPRACSSAAISLRQPAYRGANYRTVGSLANADFAMNYAFWVGIYPGLGEEAVDYITSALHAFVRNPDL